MSTPGFEPQILGATILHSTIKLHGLNQINNHLSYYYIIKSLNQFFILKKNNFYFLLKYH